MKQIGLRKSSVSMGFITVLIGQYKPTYKHTTFGECSIMAIYTSTDNTY